MIDWRGIPADVQAHIERLEAAEQRQRNIKLRLAKKLGTERMERKARRLNAEISQACQNYDEDNGELLRRLRKEEAELMGHIIERMERLNRPE